MIGITVGIRGLGVERLTDGPSIEPKYPGRIKELVKGCSLWCRPSRQNVRNGIAS